MDLPALWAVDGTVAAPPAAVAGLLLAVSEGRVGYDNLLVLAHASAARRGSMTVVAAPDTGVYRAELAGPVAPAVIRVDPASSTLAVQSWYAGIYAVTACSAGALVTHRVHRVVPSHPGFADGIADLGLRVRMRRDLDDVLGVIADRLGC
ncbi:MULTISPECIES: hypothetical protein [Kribbella]|uniref:Uncharacterized protein n=1 Tax=Kribbella karoonensis TaxID=324851 RepID=A0ABN2EUP6_9ACTN